MTLSGRPSWLLSWKPAYKGSGLEVSVVASRRSSVTGRLVLHGSSNRPSVESALSWPAIAPSGTSASAAIWKACWDERHYRIEVAVGRWDQQMKAEIRGLTRC